MTDQPARKIPICTPVPLRRRHDGWTPEKQIAFIEALAESGCVEEACRRVGMARQTAYVLRRRPCGVSFRKAWDAALDYGLHDLEQAVIGRARHGVSRPIFYQGEQVGEYRHYDERLAMFLLRTRRAQRYGGWPDREPPPVDRELPPADPEISDAGEDSALHLDDCLDKIAMFGGHDSYFGEEEEAEEEESDAPPAGDAQSPRA